MDTVIQDPEITSQDGENTTQQITFSPEQQVKVNQMMAHRAARAEETAQKKFELEKGDLLRQIEDLRKETERKPSPSGNEDVDALKGKILEYDNLVKTQKAETKKWQDEAKRREDALAASKSEMQNMQKRSAMESAAATAAQFHNPSLVIKDIADNVKWDPEHGKWVVLGDQGQVRMNAAMEPMSLVEYFKEYANQNKYLVKANLSPGMGTTPGNMVNDPNAGNITAEQLFHPKTGNTSLAVQVKKQNPALYDRLRKQAVAQGWLSL